VKRIDTVYVATRDTAPAKVLLPVAVVKHSVKKQGNVLTKMFSSQPDSSHYVTRIYRDTVMIPLGSIYITDSISGDTLIRNTISDIQTPTIREQITSVRKRAMLYAGLDIIGTKRQPFQLVGPHLSLKTKQDKLYTLGAMTGTFNRLTIDDVVWRAGVSFPIRLKRRR
jgi:hypothetical protein